MARRKHGTLAAATSTAVALTGTGITRVQVVNRGSDTIFAWDTALGTITAGADDTYAIPPGGYADVPVSDAGEDGVSVTMISTAGSDYSVESL